MRLVLLGPPDGQGYPGVENRQTLWHPAIVDRGHAARSGNAVVEVGARPSAAQVLGNLGTSKLGICAGHQKCAADGNNFGGNR
jgi:hypothetical protein